MPPAPPVAFATLAAPLAAPRPPIVSITPTTLSNHLVLSHGESFLTVADNQTLQSVERLEKHTEPVTAVACERGSIWSAGLDALVVQWDERSRRPAAEIKAAAKHPLPLTALATHDLDHLVIGGSALVGNDAHILYWDTRNTAEPAYTHSTTHADDITHLSLLPPTATWTVGAERPLPPQLLLSASKDGCVALSDPRVVDADEALQGAADWGVPISEAGNYGWKGGMRVWARSGDAVASWSVVPGEEEGLEFVDQTDVSSEGVKKILKTPNTGPSVVHPAEEERPYPAAIRSNYLAGVLPTVGISKAGTPMVGVGTDDGNIILEHEGKDGLTPSAYLMSGPDARGHKGAIHAMFHALRDEALYTGSEDGVLAGWSLASLPRLITGDPEIDDDGGDGREDIDSEDEESEIETEESDEESDRSDENEDEEDDEGPRWGRHGPVYGGGRR